MAPVMLVADSALQERPVPEGMRFDIPKLTLPSSPQGDSTAINEVARLLVEAENPVILAGNVIHSQEGMDLQRMANRYQRRATAKSTPVGSKIEDPNIDYATVARGLGVYGEGPITDPNDLRPALQRAIAVVEGGEPALVDVFSQPR